MEILAITIIVGAAALMVGRRLFHGAGDRRDSGGCGACGESSCGACPASPAPLVPLGRREPADCGDDPPTLPPG